MIVVDVQALQSEAHATRGIGRYVEALALELHRIEAADAFVYNDHLPRTGPLEAFADRVGDQLIASSTLKGRVVDVLLVASPFEELPVGDFLPPVRARHTTAICYDLIPYRFADRYLTDPVRANRYRARLGLLASADQVFAISDATATDVIELAGVDPRRVTTIGAGAGDQFSPPADDHPLSDRLAALRQRVPALEDTFVLAPVGIDWRKNVEGLIAAFGLLPQELRDRHQLVIACSANDGQRAWVEMLAAEAGVDDRVLLTGYVSDDVLVELYRACGLVVMPSLYEGFGLPVVEARRCGARVVCSDRSSLPEALPEPRAWFDPTDPADIAASIERALVDPDFAAMLDQVPDPGWSWKRTARSVAVAHDRLRSATTATTPQPPRSGVRPQIAPRDLGSERRSRLGLVTVLPPTAGGVADHSLRLADALRAEGVDVDLFVEGAPLSSHLDHDVHELATLPHAWRTRDYDHVLYVVGDNPAHASAVAMMNVVPGDVLLHDVRIPNLFRAGQADVVVAPHYEGDYRETLWSAGVARRARRVLVQSEHAAELVGADSGADAVVVGPHPIPHLELAPPADDGGPPWVCSMGFAVHAKRSDVVADMLARLSASGVARTAMIGRFSTAFVDTDSGVVAEEYVDEAEFDGWLGRASCLVQLRATTNGESSGVVARAIAAGVPLVVTDLGAMSELPDDVAVKVPVDIDAAALADLVADLVADPDRRAKMTTAARSYAAANTYRHQARRILSALG